jgi:hypothetical protein
MTPAGRRIERRRLSCSCPDADGFITSARPQVARYSSGRHDRFDLSSVRNVSIALAILGKPALTSIVVVADECFRPRAGTGRTARRQTEALGRGTRPPGDLRAGSRPLRLTPIAPGRVAREPLPPDRPAGAGGAPRLLPEEKLLRDETAAQ